MSDSGETGGNLSACPLLLPIKSLRANRPESFELAMSYYVYLDAQEMAKELWKHVPNGAPSAAPSGACGGAEFSSTFEQIVNELATADTV